MKILEEFLKDFIAATNHVRRKERVLVCQEYVDSLSGMIDVTSVPNAWTEFMVTLPEFSENKVSEVEK